MGSDFGWVEGEVIGAAGVVGGVVSSRTTVAGETSRDSSTVLEWID